MRKMILMMALAGIAAPVLADPPESRADHRAARIEERSAPPPRPAPPPGAQRPQGFGNPQAMQGPRGGPGGSGGWHGGFQPGAPGAQQPPNPGQFGRWRGHQDQARAQQYGNAPPPGGWQHRQPGPGPQGQPYNNGQYGGRGEVHGQGYYGQGYNGRGWNGQGYNGQGYNGHGWHGQAYNGQSGGPRWSNNWRRDPRYDWRGWRDRNRTIFRVGIYYDPFGYSYRPLSVGFTLSSGYYAPNYWLNDPYEYRLPPAYGSYRWVRYYNDAVLVDIYTGQVVDVLQGFFW